MGVICIVLSVVYLLSLAHSEDIMCPNRLADTSLITVYNQRCFQFVSSEKYWDEARDYCWKNSGHLVKVSDRQTNSFLVRKLDELPEWRNEGVWIGLHDTNKDLSWQWTTDDPYVTESLDWTNWGAGQPSNALLSYQCVRMVRNGNWQWLDTPCHSFLYKYRFVCEYGPYELPVQKHGSGSIPRDNTRIVKLPTLAADASGRYSSPVRQRHPKLLAKDVVINDMNVANDNPHAAAAGDVELLVEREKKEEVLQSSLLYTLLRGLMGLLFVMALCCVTAFIFLLCRAKRRQGLSTIDALSKKRVWRAMNTHGVDSVYDSHHVVFPKAPWENDYILDESRVSGKVSSGLYVPPSEKSTVDVWSVDAVNENDVNLRRENHHATDLLLATRGQEGEHIYESIDEVRRAVAALNNASPTRGEIQA